MVHSVAYTPSVIDNEKNIFIRIVPLSQLIAILNNKDVIFSWVNNFVSVTYELNLILKVILC